MQKCARLDGTRLARRYVYIVRASLARATCTKTYLRKVIFTTIVSFIFHIIVCATRVRITSMALAYVPCLVLKLLMSYPHAYHTELICCAALHGTSSVNNYLLFKGMTFHFLSVSCQCQQSSSAVSGYSTAAPNWCQRPNLRCEGRASSLVLILYYKMILIWFLNLN